MPQIMGQNEVHFTGMEKKEDKFEKFGNECIWRCCSRHEGVGVEGRESFCGSEKTMV